MANKVQKIREKVERLIEQTKPYLGACAGQVVAEANNKIAAYNEVLGILDFMQEERTSEVTSEISADMWEASKQYALRQVLASTDTKMSEQAYLSLKLFSGFEIAVAHKDGANWQKEQFEKNRLKHCNSITNEQAELEQGFIDQHLDKYQRMPTFLDAIEYGMRLQKEQMMTEAMVGAICEDRGGYLYAHVPIPFSKSFSRLDKIKALIIKEG